MIDGKRVLGVVPARGGSKGLPGKNVLTVRSRPLLDWTVKAAQASQYIDRTVLSSDDDDIIAVARACGCDVPFRRPAALASDTAGSVDVVLHALEQVPGYDVVVLLQPTSPLRSSSDIDAACERLASTGAPACVSVTAVEMVPYWMYFINAQSALEPVVELPTAVARRQDLPPVYTLNGAVYVAHVDWLRRTGSFVTRETVAQVMPRERSIDIDTIEDFEAFRTAITEESHE